MRVGRRQKSPTHNNKLHSFITACVKSLTCPQREMQINALLFTCHIYRDAFAQRERRELKWRREESKLGSEWIPYNK
jgi:hypothetical protein